MSKFAKNLYALCEKNQYKAKIVSTKHLNIIIEEIIEFQQNAVIDNAFYKERLFWVTKKLYENFQEMKSVIVVSVPRPQTKAIFRYNGSSKALIIPPTYSGYEQIRERVEKQIEKILKHQNYLLKRISFPLKALAVRSGLAEYGKNNICYVSGMGSYLQLIAVFSNIPNNQTLRKPKMMKLCYSCNLCQRACPTLAISKNRFLLYAEKCLTFHNEREGNYQFPDWIKKNWHNCIVGCMHCQNICPANKNFTKWIGNEEHFSEKETDQLLNQTKKEDLSKNTLKKLDRLNLTDYLSSLSRNLSVFFD